MQEEVKIPDGYDIYWEAWIDAYDNDEINRIKNEHASQLQDEFEEDFDDEEINPSFFEQPIKTILTPFGILPVTELSLASKHFKFWVGHTNFKLIEEYEKILDKCEGVEAVDILTPYRFRIAVGKLFQDREVMLNVKTILLGVVNESKKQR